MQRNQHGAHSLGVGVGVVDEVRSADVGESADDVSSQMSPDPWLVRILHLITYILRLPTGAECDLAFSHAQTLGRVIHALCLEAEREMMATQPASGVPVDLPLHVQRVLALAFFGMKPPEIAARLNLSPKTVTSYLRDAASQLGVSGTENAVREAFRRRLLLFDNAEALLGLPPISLPPMENLPQRE